VAKDYAAIARARIHRPGEGGRKPRILIYGRNKKGKTRFCTTAPNVLILDPEDGTREEKKSNPDVWPVTQWQDLDDAYGFLKGGGKSPKTNQPYEWVALDGMTRIGAIAIRFIMDQEAERDLARKPSDTKIQDYGKANKMVEAVLHNFHSLRNIGIVLTAQERMVEIENMEDLGDDDEATPAGYMYVPDLSKGARAPLNQIVDVIGRIYVVRGDFTVKKRIKVDGVPKVKSVETKSQRRLWIGSHEMYDTGARSDFELPDFIKNPTVGSVVRAMREGKVAA
jgi:hypothetical protein